MEDFEVQLMGDFPATTVTYPAGGCIHSGHQNASTYALGSLGGNAYAAAAWPAANLGIFIPFVIDLPATAKQMFWENGGVAGTTDIGIYDSNKVLLVNLTATTNAGSIQIGNITDTALKPGLYYMAMVASTVTTQTYVSAAISTTVCRAAGMQQQAIGSATLPANATFAAIGQAYIPLMGISFQATM